MKYPDKRDVPEKQDINVMALVKGNERYVFLYDDESRKELLLTLGRFASNPELSFTWYDAGVLLKKVRDEFQRKQYEEYLETIQDSHLKKKLRGLVERILDSQIEMGRNINLSEALKKAQRRLGIDLIDLSEDSEE
jgi:hypothetical protein